MFFPCVRREIRFTDELRFTRPGEKTTRRLLKPQVPHQRLPHSPPTRIPYSECVPKRRNAVGIAQGTAVKRPKDRGENEADHRDGGKDRNKVETRAHSRPSPPNQRELDRSANHERAALPNNMEPSMPRPKVIGGVGPIEIDGA